MSHRAAYAFSWAICAWANAWVVLHTIAMEYGDPPNYLGLVEAALTVIVTAGTAGYLSGGPAQKEGVGK